MGMGKRRLGWTWLSLLFRGLPSLKPNPDWFRGEPHQFIAGRSVQRVDTTTPSDRFKPTKAHRGCLLHSVVNLRSFRSVQKSASAVKWFCFHCVAYPTARAACCSYVSRFSSRSSRKICRVREFCIGIVLGRYPVIDGDRWGVVDLWNKINNRVRLVVRCVLKSIFSLRESLWFLKLCELLECRSTFIMEPS